MTINDAVKIAEHKRKLKAKQVAMLLDMSENTYTLTVGHWRNNPKNIEKIAEFHGISCKHVNPNYKGDGK